MTDEAIALYAECRCAVPAGVRLRTVTEGCKVTVRAVRPEEQGLIEDPEITTYDPASLRVDVPEPIRWRRASKAAYITVRFAEPYRRPPGSLHDSAQRELCRVAAWRLERELA